MRPIANASEPLFADVGIRIAVLVDADDGPDDHALHDASVAEGLIVRSLRRCNRFSTPPGGLRIGFGSVANDQVGEAMDAVDRMLERLGQALSPRLR